MDKKSLTELRKTLGKELDEIARKPEMSMGDLEALHKLTDTIKNIDKICMLEENGGYSNDGEWMAEGTYGRGSSYANRGQHWVRGHYSRDDGYSHDDDYRRDSDMDYSNARRGGYSRDGAKDKMIRQLHQMVDNADNETIRSTLYRCINQLENA